MPQVFFFFLDVVAHAMHFYIVKKVFCVPNQFSSSGGIMLLLHLDYVYIQVKVIGLCYLYVKDESLRTLLHQN